MRQEPEQSFPGDYQGCRVGVWMKRQTLIAEQGFLNKKMDMAGMIIYQTEG
jgi:hypothetical protein